MLTRTLIGTGVVALLAGCGDDKHLDGHLPPEPRYSFARCPDDCTHSNGTGVYMAEEGYAGMGDSQLMITHFVNNPGGQVTFEGHYFDASTGSRVWARYQGYIYSADYQQQTDLLVTSVSESSTIPTWTLLAPTTGATITVAEHQLVELKLHIDIPATESGAPAEERAIVISFTSDSEVRARPGKPPIRKYKMLWRDQKRTEDPTPYCIDASHHADGVVFQQGIDVDPVTGAVTRSQGNSFVTMSCYLGAIATVHGWGYAYQATPVAPPGAGVPGTQPGSHDPTFYFDAGIQMKRASYCADSHFYTQAGTPIDIADDLAINQDATSNLEALWTPNGASCLNSRNKRHGLMGFDDTCNSTKLPPCSPLSANEHVGYLADGPSARPTATTATQPWLWP